MTLTQPTGAARGHPASGRGRAPRRPGRRRLLATALTLAAVLVVLLVTRWDPLTRAWPFGLREGCALTEGGRETRLTVAEAGAATDALGGVGAKTATAEARVLAGRIRAGGEAALSCQLRAPQVAAEAAGPNGLTPRAGRVRQRLEAVFGPQSLGGFAPGGVSTGHTAGSAHYDGRALDVFFRPASAANQRRGWLVAQWAVAHARELGVATVIFDDQIWSTARSREGWRPYTPPRGPTSNPILRHLDHVHVDVLAG